MKTWAIALALALAGTAAAQAPSLADFDRQVERELAAKDPQAVALFREATQARDRGDVVKAGELYERVEKLVPTSSHAFRRHAAVELQRHHADVAVALARKAVALDESAYNLATLALTLVEAPAERTANRDEAVQLARRAHALVSNDALLSAEIGEVAVAAGDASLLDDVIGDLQRADPDGVPTLYLRSILAAMRGQFEDAIALLDRAHERGLPDAGYRQLRSKLRDAEPLPERVLPLALRLGGGWLAGMAVLFLVGLVLSALTLRACRRPPTELQGHARGAERLLRRVYGAVLAVCCAYYYISIPFALASVLLGGGGIIYACFAIGRIPIKLVLLVLVAVIVSVVAVIKSLFIRAHDQDPGRKLALEEHPQLRRVLEEVAARVGTRPVDSVYLTPGAQVAVTERGGMLRQLRGTSERCLILGVAVLEGMDTGALKAVLAHEYGHFVNRDTAGGGLALMVRRSLFSMAVELARGGQARWWNPAWLFVNGFHRVFLHISQGASRLQEVLADRRAAVAYGPEAFERGLRHVIAASVRFDAHANATLKEVTDAGAALSNLYRHQLAQALDEATMAQQISEAIGRAASPYDSHPSPLDRFTWVRAIGAVHAPAADDATPAWSLFADRERCEQLMTSEVRESVERRFGVSIPAVAPPLPPTPPTSEGAAS